MGIVENSSFSMHSQAGAWEREKNNIIFRKHNSDNIVKLMNDWWEELNTQTKRDQLSLAYVLWKNGENFNFMDESAREGKGYFEYVLHNEFKDRSFFSKAKDSLRVRTMTKVVPMLTRYGIMKL